MGLGRVVLPTALDRKYPNASTDWLWQFVFPAGRICRDPREEPDGHTFAAMHGGADSVRTPQRAGG